MPQIYARTLSSELGVPDSAVEAILRRYFAFDDDDASERPVSELQAAAVRNRLSPSRQELPWVIPIGSTRPRREIHGLYGGQEQGGISTPKGSKTVLAFTDPAAGRRFGYDRFEGLHEDGSYAYTGEGQVGDQVFGAGNAALRDAAAAGSVIRLFRTHGTRATYVGEFTTSVPAFHTETIPDSQGQPRRGIIFHLIPLNARTDLLPTFGGESEDFAEIYGTRPLPLSWSPPDYSDFVVPGASDAVTGERTVSRVEFQLQNQFGSWMQQQGDRPSRLRLRSGSAVIEPDFYFEKKAWIVEAKRSTARGFVREAVGQVLDYVNVAGRAGLPTAPAILLPGRPEDDLQSLLSKHGIMLAARTESGFELSPPQG